MQKTSGLKINRPIWLALICILLSGMLFVSVNVVNTAAEENTESRPFGVKVSGTGRPMLLISGLAWGGNVWDETAAHFRDDYKVYVLTLAGFGGQPAIAPPFMEQVRDGIIAYIREQELEQPILIGHSLGAMTAFWVGVTVPAEVGPMIAVDGLPSFGALYNKKPKSWMSRLMSWFISRKIRKQTPEEFAEKNRENLNKMITSPDDIDAVARISDRSDPQAVGQAFYEMMTFDIRQEVQKIQSPVLLLGATADITDPVLKKKREAQYQSQMSEIPVHKVVFAPNARHFIQLDEPEWFYRQVESFLDKHGHTE